MDKFLMFPLYSLQFSEDKHELMEHIISYGLVHYSKMLKESFELYESDENSVLNCVSKNSFVDFDKYSEDDYYLVLAYKKLDCSSKYLKTTRKKYEELSRFIKEYESIFGRDAKVSVHKNILFEVKGGSFDFDLFRVYCGVLARIGNKPFLRITCSNISYTMMGYKSKKVFLNTTGIYEQMTERKIRTRLMKLQQKNLIDFITYRRRLVFYSSRFKHERLNALVEQALLKRKVKKLENSSRSLALDRSVSQKYEQIKEEIRGGRKLEDFVQQKSNEISPKV